MRIVVGYDGSHFSKEAVKVARRRAKESNAQMYVVTSMAKGEDKQQLDIEEAEKGLQHVKSLFDADKTPCEVHLLIHGLSPGEDIVDFAEAQKADEIIIGVRKRSKVGKLLFGSTAQFIILEAHCPVLCVR